MKTTSEKPSSLCKRPPFLPLARYVGLVLMAFTTITHAVQPLTESDMSDISLESATLERLLGVDGSTAAGEDYIAQDETTRDMNTSLSAANADRDRLHKTETESDSRQPVVQASTPKPEDHNTVVTSSSKTSHAETTVTFAPKLRAHESSSNHSSNLNLQGNVSIQSVYLQNVRDSSNTIRGSYFMSDVHTSTNTSINSR